MEERNKIHNPVDSVAGQFPLSCHHLREILLRLVPQPLDRTAEILLPISVHPTFSEKLPISLEGQQR